MAMVRGEIRMPVEVEVSPRIFLFSSVVGFPDVRLVFLGRGRSGSCSIFEMFNKERCFMKNTSVS